MMIKNAEITRQARLALKNNWVNPILVSLLFMLLTGLCGWIHPFFGGFLGLIVCCILTPGFIKFFLESTSRKDVEIEMLFSEYKRFVTMLIFFLLLTVGMVVGFILLIVPGIIFMFGMYMTYFIIVENPEMSAVDAMKLSWKMMKGKKWKFFLLGLRFFGWYLLAILTLGIGLIWLMPYVMMAQTIFYQEAKKDYFGQTEEPQAETAPEEPVTEAADENISPTDGSQPAE